MIVAQNEVRTDLLETGRNEEMKVFKFNPISSKVAMGSQVR